MKQDHECIIGILNDYDDTRIVTLSQLKEDISDRKQLQEWQQEYLERNEDGFVIPVTVYTLKDYADKRKNTDLRRFSHCCDCGKMIDWKNIGKNIGKE